MHHEQTHEDFAPTSSKRNSVVLPATPTAPQMNLANLDPTSSPAVPLISFLVLFYAFGICMYLFTDETSWRDHYFPAENGKPALLDCVIQGSYYATQVLTTIGFGDVVPVSPALQVLDACYIFVGVLFLGTSVLTNAIEQRVRAQVAQQAEEEEFQNSLRLGNFRREHLFGRGSMLNEDSFTHTKEQKHQIMTRQQGELSPRRKRDLAQGRRRRNELLQAVLWVVVPGVAGAVVFGIGAGWDVAESVNWAVVVMSTTGFGDHDVAPRWLRALSVIYLLLAVVCFAVGVGKLSALLVEIATARSVGGGSDSIEHMDRNSPGNRGFTQFLAGWNTVTDTLRRLHLQKADRFDFLSGVLLESGKLDEADFVAIMDRFDALDEANEGILRKRVSGGAEPY